MKNINLIALTTFFSLSITAAISTHAEVPKVITNIFEKITITSLAFLNKITDPFMGNSPKSPFKPNDPTRCIRTYQESKELVPRWFSTLDHLNTIKKIESGEKIGFLDLFRLIPEYFYSIKMGLQKKHFESRIKKIGCKKCTRKCRFPRMYDDVIDAATSDCTYRVDKITAKVENGAYRPIVKE